MMSSAITRCTSNFVRQFYCNQNSSSLRLFSSTANKMAAQKNYKLIYFNFRVLGEPIRWQFALAGVPFEDFRLQRDSSWEAEHRNKNGWGRLPILKIDEDIELTQSAAISRYLAKQFNLLPEDDLLKARCDELVDNLQDLRMLWRPWVRESEPTKKAVLAEEMKSTHFPFYLEKVNHFVKTYGGSSGYAVGDKLTWADLYLANFLEIWTDNHGKDILKKYPSLENHKNKILSIPQIKEWNSKRPKTTV